MKPITDRQQWQHGFKFNKGKVSKFDDTKFTLPEGSILGNADGIAEYQPYTVEDFIRASREFDGAPEYEKEMIDKIRSTEAAREAAEKNGYTYTKPARTSSLFKSFFNDFVPYGLMMMPAIDQWTYYKGNQPYAANSYVANPTARQALNVLGSMRYDPYNKIQAVKDANRQAIYSINHMGGLSRGQRMAMLTAQNNNYAKNIASIYGDADQVNNQYKQVFANALNSEGRDAATRSQ